MPRDGGRRDIGAVVFDLGGVLIDWDPRYLYRSLFEHPDEMETFLRDVCSPAWIRTVDAGAPFADAVRELAALHPDQRELIEAFHVRWRETLGGSIDGSVSIVEELHESSIGLYALSNWSVETFPIAEERFPFLSLFDGILISGDARYAKPARQIFEIFLGRFGLDARRCAFIDDRAENVEVAADLGFDAIRYESPDQLRRELERRGLPVILRR